VDHEKHNRDAIKQASRTNKARRVRGEEPVTQPHVLQGRPPTASPESPAAGRRGSSFGPSDGPGRFVHVTSEQHDKKGECRDNQMDAHRNLQEDFSTIMQRLYPWQGPVAFQCVLPFMILIRFHSITRNPVFTKNSSASLNGLASSDHVNVGYVTKA
jgi:hypothetical protein